MHRWDNIDWRRHRHLDLEAVLLTLLPLLVLEFDLISLCHISLDLAHHLAPELAELLDDHPPLEVVLFELLDVPDEQGIDHVVDHLTRLLAPQPVCLH